MAVQHQGQGEVVFAIFSGIFLYLCLCTGANGLFNSSWVQFHTEDKKVIKRISSFETSQRLSIGRCLKMGTSCCLVLAVDAALCCQCDPRYVSMPFSHLCCSLIRQERDEEEETYF